MRKAACVGIGVTVTGIVVYGAVVSGMTLDVARPWTTYLGFFQHILFSIERSWSAAHGWTSLSHIDDFGRFYAGAVSFGAPLLGFLAYLAAARPEVGRKLLTPLAIALSQITPLTQAIDYPLRTIGLRPPASVLIPATLVLLAMIWSSGASRSAQDWRPGNQLDHWPPVEPADSAV